MAETTAIFKAMNAEERIRKAKVQLSINNAFLSHLILKLKVVEDTDKTDTMSTDGKYIYYNKEFVESLDQSQLFFVIKHELYHILFIHPFRVEHRKLGLFNIAADLIVNYKLIKKKT